MLPDEQNFQKKKITISFWNLPVFQLLSHEEELIDMREDDGQKKLEERKTATTGNEI